MFPGDSALWNLEAAHSAQLKGQNPRHRATEPLLPAESLPVLTPRFDLLFCWVKIKSCETSFPTHSLCCPSENTHEVVLKKSLSGLGFSFNISQLRSGPDRGSVVRIKRLFPGQPALESGLLREGDIILSVNKEPVKDLSYQVLAQEVCFCLTGTSPFGII